MVEIDHSNGSHNGSVRHCYFDALAVSLGRTESTHFTDNPNRWAEVVQDGSGRIENDYPELLKGVEFVVTKDHQVGSGQVDLFLSILTTTGITVLNSSTHAYEVDAGVKDALIDKYGCFVQNFEGATKLIAKLFDERLGVHK